MYNKNDKIVERLLDEVDEKYLSDEDIAAQYDDFSCTYLKLEKGHPSVENWYNFTLELEFPEADHPDFSDYVVENGYYNKDDDVWGFYNWYPEETKNKIKAIILKEIDDMEAQGLTELETDMQSKQLELNFENNDIAESLINEDDATGHVDIKALDTNKFGEVENLEFELVHDGETYYVECYAPDLANEDYYVIRVYKTEGQQLNNETEVAKGYTDSTGGVFAGDELEFYDYENDYSELTQKIMDVILANLKEVVSHEQLESKMNEISDKVVSDVTGRRASDYIWTKMHPDENSPEDTEKMRKKLARNLELVNKRNARKDKENNMQNDDIAESLLKGEELSEAKIVEEDLNDLLSMSGERYTNIADLDMPAPLADSVPTTEDGEPITIELLYKAITDLTATIGNLATSIKQPKVELKPLENPMGQPAPKAEPALTDDLIGELDNVADDVADDEQKIADDEKDIKDKESEIEDDAEDLDELDKEIEADLDNTEKADKKKKDKKSDKDEDDKKKKNEDLETAKKEIDKAIADKKSPEEIDATIDYTTDNDTDEKAANEYKVQKMKEACKASVANSLLNKLKWGN